MVEAKFYASVRRMRRRLLTYDEAAIPEDGTAVYSQMIGLTSSFAKDPAGHVFHFRALQQAGLIDATEQDDGEADVGASEADSESFKDSRQGSAADFSSLNANGGLKDEWKGRKSKKSKPKKTLAADLYALLGLQHERWMATESQIRAAYRRAALEHHPDKQHAASGGDEAAMAAAEERFKAIQEAYETLMDGSKRREYDSLDSFDDSLPGEGEAATPEAFYANFGAAFRRNGKWSVNQPVPELGGDQTDMDHVDNFYDFWFSFKSWREFPHPDEEDIEMAESREERRWIERFNSKLRDKGKKEEVRRIREFVELSHRTDPRIARRREAQRAEKERLIAEREAEKARRAEEERRKVEEEERRKAEEAAAAAEAKKQRQIEKKALQKERARLRKLCAEGILTGEEDVELLCSALGLAALGALCDQLADASLSAATKTAVLVARLDEVQRMQEEENQKKGAAVQAAASAAKEAAKQEGTERLSRLREWDEEEIRMLRKAIDRFPAGTSRRWEQVQAYLRTRSVDEILDMVKHGLKSGKYTAPSADGPQIAKKRQANTVIRSDATRRDESFSDIDVNLRGPAAVALGDGTSAAPVAEPPPKEDVWTQKEELALVKALKEIPKDAPDRWDRVAAAVATKSKAACARRFKEMKDSYKSKKSNA